MYKGLSVSVVIPCFNEEHGIAAVLKGMPGYIDQVVVVDNNSTDETGRIAREMGAEVIFETRKGYGNAYMAGFPRARGQIVATADGDGTYPTHSIGPIIDYMLDKNLDFVSASRFPLKNPKAMRFRNVLGNKILTYVVRILWLRWIADSQSGMWVMRHEALDGIKLRSEGMSFSEEIKLEVIEQGSMRFGEYHVDYSERIGETKLFPFRDGVENILYLFERRFRGTNLSKIVRQFRKLGQAKGKGSGN
ncbi:MAG: glycosyltransferase family 2 protein [Chloroflexota bacterium]|nr:glycosyltransferase family 2 protein [Chloroflexota bacterium]